MRYFKKLPNLPVVVLPGRGRVHDHDLLVGDEYAQFVPFHLYEVDANGHAVPVKATYVAPPQESPFARKVEVTHVSYPARPPPPPHLQKAWEARQPVLTKAPGFSMEDALSRAAAETVPLPSESPAIAAVEAAPAVESPPVENPATMAEQAPPKRKRGRPRKNPLPPQG